MTANTTTPDKEIKQRWDALVSKCSNEDELTLVEMWGNAIARYVNHVAWMARNVAIWRLDLEPDEYKQKTMEADRLRTTYHNSCVNGVAKLNASSAAKSLPPLFDGDDKDRYAVADFAGRFAAACYEARKGMDLANTRSQIKQLNETAPDTAEPDGTTYELD